MKNLKLYYPILLIALSLLLAACGDGSAASMRLKKTEGKVQVNDAREKDVEVRENLGLYSGYGVKTKKESYAWVELDSVKLAKLDVSSKIEIEKKGKDLTIQLKDGNVFFNITEPLKDDETMTIRTSTMAVGIRGTSGWIETPKDEPARVYLLDGKVKCSSDKKSTDVSAGEMAFVGDDGKFVVEEYDPSAIPSFVLNEMGDVLPLAKAVNLSFSNGTDEGTTSLTLNPDGTFFGIYYDSRMGEGGAGYSSTIYICNFQGKFKDVQQVDEYTYSMQLDYCNSDKAEGDTWIDGQVKYVAKEQYGIAGGKAFELYLPKKPVSSLPKPYIDSVGNLQQQTSLPGYGLYNVEAQSGFATSP